MDAAVLSSGTSPWLPQDTALDLNTPGFLSRYFRDDVLKEAVVAYER